MEMDEKFFSPIYKQKIKIIKYNENGRKFF